MTYREAKELVNQIVVFMNTLRDGTPCNRAILDDIEDFITDDGAPWLDDGWLEDHEE